MDDNEQMELGLLELIEAFHPDPTDENGIPVSTDGFIMGDGEEFLHISSEELKVMRTLAPQRPYKEWKKHVPEGIIKVLDETYENLLQRRS